MNRSHSSSPAYLGLIRSAFVATCMILHFCNADSQNSIEGFESGIKSDFELQGRHKIYQSQDSSNRVLVDWAQIYSSRLVPTIDVAKAMTVDSAGNVIVTGYTRDLSVNHNYLTVKYNSSGMQLWAVKQDDKRAVPVALASDGQGNVFVTGSVFEGRSDFYTIKYDPYGFMEWEAIHNTDEHDFFEDHPSDVVIDSEGNVYVTGGSAAIEGGGTAYLTVKYSPDGEEIWVARYGNDMPYNHAQALDVDSMGNVVVTGSFINPETDFDIVTIKYDRTGSEMWIVNYDGSYPYYMDRAVDITIDNLGNIYVTGDSYSQDNQFDFVSIKYNSDGDELWSRHYDAYGQEDSPSEIGLDHSGNIIVAGSSYSETSDYDFVIVKYNNAGQEQWTARYDVGGGSCDKCTGLSIDASGNVYATGKTSSAGPDSDYVTVAYNPSGDLLWVDVYDGPAADGDGAIDLAVDPEGNLIVSGTSRGPDTHYDFATLKYGVRGQLLWESRYDGPNESRDVPVDMEIDDRGHVFVTLRSKGPDRSDDIALIHYDEYGGEEWISRFSGIMDGDDTPDALTVSHTSNDLVILGTTWTGTTSDNGRGRDLVTISYNQNGHVNWMSTYDEGYGGQEYGSDVAMDSSGNIYSTGYSWTGAGKDFVTLKYTAAGQLLWNVIYDGPAPFSFDGAQTINIDGSDNILVSGTSEITYDRYDFLTVKYDSNGNEIWIVNHSSEGDGDACLSDASVDKRSNIYVTGQERGLDGLTQWATICYDSLGIEQWISTNRGSDGLGGAPKALATDNRGRCYVTGYVYEPGWDFDMETVRYNANGNEDWISHYNGGSGYNDIGVGLFPDNECNVYVLGQSKSDLIIIKYDSLGVMKWKTTYDVQDGIAVIPIDIDVKTVNGIADIYVSGYLANSGRSACLTIKYREESLHVDDRIGIPSVTKLLPNHPNPFVRFTALEYWLDNAKDVELGIYDISGRRIRILIDAILPSGFHTVQWDRRDTRGNLMPYGTYICRFKAGDYREQQILIAKP